MSPHPCTPTSAIAIPRANPLPAVRHPSSGASAAPALCVHSPDLPAGAWWACAAAAALVLLAPLLVTDMPPLLDYPNHLARMVVLAAGPADPVLSRMYATHWGLIPNLAIDVLIPPMLAVLPLHVAGRLVLALTLLLPCAGVLAYSRATFGRRLLWPLASSLIACNALFLLGFVNFQLGLGLALLIAALWSHGRTHAPLRTSLVCAAAGILLFFCHLSGLLFLAVLVASHEAGRLLPLRGVRLLREAAASAGLIVLMLLPAALLTLASPFEATTSAPTWSSSAEKTFHLLLPVLNYSLRLDLLTAFLIVAFVCVGVRQRRLDIPPSTAIALAVLLALYAASPFSAKGGMWMDARFPMMIGFLLFAGFGPRLPRRVAIPVALAAAILLLVRTALVASIWSGHNIDLAQLRAAIAPVAPGARVLVVSVSPANDPAYWSAVPRSRYVVSLVNTEFHEAALLLIERHAFWPLLFASASQQPLTVRPPYRELSFNGLLPPWQALTADPPRAADLAGAPYLADWQNRFDNVLVLDADGVPDLAHHFPAKLKLLTDTGFAALFRIEKTLPEARPEQLIADKPGT